jgi:hypothetical protein
MNEFLPSKHARSVLLGDRQCTATNRDGSRCGRASSVGAFTCDKHGGKAPLSLQAARERLLELAEPAIGALRRVIESHGPPCAACGRSDADRDPTVVRAAQIILDRTGHHPSINVQYTPQVLDPEFEAMSVEQCKAEALRLMELSDQLIRQDQERFARRQEAQEITRRALPQAEPEPPYIDFDIDIDVLDQDAAVPNATGIRTPETWTDENCVKPEENGDD